MKLNRQISEIEPIIKEIVAESKKNQKKPAFAIITTQRMNSKEVVFLPIRRTNNLVCGAATVYTLESAKKIVKSIDGRVDYIIIDAEQKTKGLQNLVKLIIKQTTKSKILTFKSSDSTADATDCLVANLFPISHGKKISIIGAGNIGSKVALKLVERGFDVSVSRRRFTDAKKISAALNLIKPKFCRTKIIPKSSSNIAKNCDALIGFTEGIPVITSMMIKQMKRNGIVLDGGIGTVQSEAIKAASAKGIKILRIDARAGFASAMKLLFETNTLLDKTIGHSKFKGVEIVAGGIYGKYGDIVVDSIDHPKKFIGISDGMGGILERRKTKEFESKIKIVKQWINKKKD